MSVGSILREERVRAGLTSTEVAAALGVSIWTYSRVESDQRTFDDGWIGRFPDVVRGAIAERLAEHARRRADRIALSGASTGGKVTMVRRRFPFTKDSFGGREAS